MSEPKDTNLIQSTESGTKIIPTLNLTELRVFEMIQSGKMGTEKLAIAVELIEKVKTFISEYIDFGDISKEKIEKFENFIMEKLVGYEIKRKNGDYDFQKSQYNLESKTLDEFIGDIASGGQKMPYKDFRDKKLNYLVRNLR